MVQVNGTAIKAATIVAVLAFVGSLPASANSTEPDGAVNPLIVGGEELTDISQNPGAVGLHVEVDDPNSTGLVCGAIRIAPDWALTAKHCIVEHGKKYTFDSISSYTIDRRFGPRITFEPSKVIFHPGKNVDAALIPLDEAGPGMIATYTTRKPQTGETLVTMGWGRTTPDSVDTTILKRATSTVTEMRNARGMAPPKYNGGEHIVTKAGTGRCWQGDSGGPIFDEKNHVIGITAWSDPVRAGEELLGRCGYLHMGSVSDWIKQQTGVSPGQVFDTIPLPEQPTTVRLGGTTPEFAAIPH